MRLALATLLLTCTSAPIAAAADRYSGRYSASCGDLVCELDVRPSPDGWKIVWTASDPTQLDAVPVCAFTTTAELGSARLGPAGVVEGVAVGRVDGMPFGGVRSRGRARQLVVDLGGVRRHRAEGDLCGVRRRVTVKCA